MRVYDYIALKEFDEINALKTTELKGERQAKIEIAKVLLSLGDSLEKISKATNLSIQEIERLKS